MWEKERVLGEEEGERIWEEEVRANLRGRESVKTYCKCENWPNMSLFIARILWAYYLLYFYLFYKKELYFTISLNK